MNTKKNLLKIAILPNGYKDHISSDKVSNAIERGLKSSN